VLFHGISVVYPVIIQINPDRPNLHLEIKPRLPNREKFTKYDEIIQPIAEELKLKRENFPLTIVYVESLEAMGYFYQLPISWKYFSKVVGVLQCMIWVIPGASNPIPKATVAKTNRIVGTSLRSSEIMCWRNDQCLRLQLLGYFGFHQSRYDGPGHDCCSYCRNSLV
jgi:hypothetical protein